MACTTTRRTARHGLGVVLVWLAVLMPVPSPAQSPGATTLQMQLRFVDASGRPLVALPVRLCVGRQVNTQAPGVTLVSKEAGTVRVQLAHAGLQRSVRMPGNFVTH